MKSNPYWALRIAFWLIVIVVVVLLIVLPLLTSWLISVGRMPVGVGKYLIAVEYLQTYLMRGLALLWLFFLGSCFASFLNVVAWRVPRGRGINGSSHCPNCDSKLSFGDNIPIAGWLRNAGQCRTCRIPISPRYLWVEVALGFVFLAVCTIQILYGGINLPVREIDFRRGIEHMIFDPQWNLIQLTIFHLVLICLLFTFVLIRSERLKIPVAILVTGIAFGITLPLIWPSMLLVSWQIGTDQLVELTRFSVDQLLTLGLGLTGGIGFGLIAQWALGFDSGNRNECSALPPPAPSTESDMADETLTDENSSLTYPTEGGDELNRLISSNPYRTPHSQSDEKTIQQDLSQTTDFQSALPNLENLATELDSDSDSNQQHPNEQHSSAAEDARQRLIAKAAITNAPIIQNRFVYQCVAAFGLIGLFLGWQSALSIAIIVNGQNYGYGCTTLGGGFAECGQLTLDLANRMVNFDSVIVSASGPNATGTLELNGTFSWSPVP